MKQWFLSLPQPARLVASLLAGASALLLWLLLSTLIGWWLDNREVIATIEPRIARLKGYTEVEPQLRETVAALDQRLASMAFPASMDTSQAGAELQQQLRSFAESAGLTVRGSQLVQRQADLEDEERYDQLTVQLNMVGEPIAIDDFLTQVFEAEPLMVVDSLDLSRQRLTARDRRRQQQQGEAINLAELMVSARISSARRIVEK